MKVSKVAYRVLNLCGLATFDLIVQVTTLMFLMTRWCPWWHDDVHGYTIMFMVYLLCLYSHEKVRFTYLFFKLQNTFFQVTEYFYLDIFPRMTCLFFLKSTLCQWSDQIVLWTDRWQNINFCLAAEIFVFIRKTFLKLQLILYSGANIFPIHP